MFAEEVMPAFEAQVARAMTDVIDCEFSVEGNGPPLFLIHGIGAARDTWRKALPILTPHFTVVTYDLRGHGASPMPDGEFGLEELVNDLERVRERTGFEQAHFAGHSLGGMIGPAYARRYPERVLSLGLLSTAAFRTEDDSTKVWARGQGDGRKGHSAGSRHSDGPLVHRCLYRQAWRCGGTAA